MYGLPENGGTCPGATAGKGGCLDTRDGYKRPTCYMAKITSIYKAVGNVLLENTELFKGKNVRGMEKILVTTMADFLNKNEGELLHFRLHYSGDFFSRSYAKAWANTIKQFPEIQFWTYTRSFEYVDELVGITNLTLYLSCDPANFSSAIETYDKYSSNVNLGLAWLGNEAPEPEKFRWVKCPEVTGKVKNTDTGGACSKCRLCVDNYKIRVKNIQFPIH
jgi:hypothetical protein